MIGQALNRLWVRFSLAIIAIVFAVTVLPAASLLLVAPQDIVSGVREYVESVDAAAELELSLRQINSLTDALAQEIEQEYYDDIRFLLLTTLIVGVLAGAVLGRGLSLPIERLAAATKAVGARDLSYRVDVSGAREIQELADNFNRMTAELARSEQLRRNLMADVSHELLTPLTVLQGNLRAILEDVYELNKDEISTLYEQNRHLIRLVRDLRQLAQAEAGQLTFNVAAVDLAALISETTSFFVPTAAENKVHLIHEIPTDLAPLQADPGRLRQVLHNLVANAIRHTPDGGKITISARKTAAEFRISVADTGTGFASDQGGQLFDRFYRTEESRRRDRGGAGLGLAISKAIVEAHNGRIEAISPGVNQGTTVTIFLPETQP